MHYSRLFTVMTLVSAAALLRAAEPVSDTDNDKVYFAAQRDGVHLRQAKGRGKLSSEELAGLLVVSSDADLASLPAAKGNRGSAPGIVASPTPPSAAGTSAPAPGPSGIGMVPGGEANELKSPPAPQLALEREPEMPREAIMPDVEGNVFLSDLARQGNHNPFDPARVLTGKADSRTIEVICTIAAKDGRCARINGHSLMAGGKVIEGVLVETIRRAGVLVRVQSGNALVYCPVGLRIRLVTNPS